MSWLKLEGLSCSFYSNDTASIIILAPLLVVLDPQESLAPALFDD